MPLARERCPGASHPLYRLSSHRSPCAQTSRGEDSHVLITPWLSKAPGMGHDDSPPPIGLTAGRSRHGSEWSISRHHYRVRLTMRVRQLQGTQRLPRGVTARGALALLPSPALSVSPAGLASPGSCVSSRHAAAVTTLVGESVHSDPIRIVASAAACSDPPHSFTAPNSTNIANASASVLRTYVAAGHFARNASCDGLSAP